MGSRRLSKMGPAVATAVWIAVPLWTAASAPSEPQSEPEPQSPPQVLRCATAPAVTSSLAGDTSEREELAKIDALTALARQVWSDALRSDPGSGLAATGAERAFALLRARYQVDELLVGGTYEFGEDDRDSRVEYCVTRDVYRNAIDEIRRRRQETIEELRLGFAHVEQLVREENYDAAAPELTELDLRVVSEVLEQTPYRSVVQDRTRSFYVWLLEWSDVVPRGPEYPRIMTARAEDLVGAGHLESADRYVSEALKADPEYPPALALRTRIQDLRVERAALLRNAKELASQGRFRRAERDLDQARQIGSDDPLGVEEAAEEIVAQRATFYEHNPRHGVVFFGGFGTLGVDTSSVDQRVTEASNIKVGGDAPLSFGLGGHLSMGRNGLVVFTGSWGVAQDSVNSGISGTAVLYETAQVTAGVGLRTLRSPKRAMSIQVVVGTALEWADANPLVRVSDDTSDSQVAMFIRVGAQFKTAVVFLQHGFGFSDTDPDSTLIGWSNNFEFGAGVSF